MGPHDLNRMFDRLSPAPEQEQAVWDRLLDEERKASPMRRLKKLMVLGVAAALMIVTCAAAVVTGIDQRLLDCFGGTPEDVALISPAAVEVGASHTYESGWTVEISQVLADRLSLAVLVDVTAPEGTVLEEGDQLALVAVQLDGQGERVAGPALLAYIRQLEDGDPADDHMTVLWQVRKTKGEGSVPYIGSSVELIPGGVRFREGDRMVPVWFSGEDGGGWDSWWSCTVQLPDEDPGVTCPMDQPLAIGDVQVRLTGLYLSPLSLTVYVEDEEQKLRAPQWDDPETHHGKEWIRYLELMQLRWEDNVVLHRADGTQITATETQGQIVGVSYTLCFDQILDVEEIVSVTLFGQTYQLK